MPGESTARRKPLQDRIIRGGDGHRRHAAYLLFGNTGAKSVARTVGSERQGLVDKNNYKNV